MFLGVAALAVVIYRLVLGEPLALLKRARDIGLTGALLVAPILLVAWPYRRVQQEMGLRRTLENWTVTSSSYLASPSHVHQWVLSWFSDVKFHELATAYLFPGILPVGLAVAASSRAATRDWPSAAWCSTACWHSSACCCSSTVHWLCGRGSTGGRA